MNKKVMIIYPPGRMFQRGEERCQIDINASSVNNNRACNDLGYICAILKNEGYATFLKDYQGEKLSTEELLSDFNKITPDVVFISTTNGSINDDLKTVDLLKQKNKNTVLILKGSVFFNPDSNFLNNETLKSVDYLIGAEAEFIIKDLIYAHFNNKELLKNIKGISYKDSNNNWISNFIYEFKDDLDSLPYPDRSSMKNDLYINPATNKPMALITMDKGCPYNCIYCLSPIISGKKIRTRKIENIIKEIKECIEIYNITDFFFKSDTFTANKDRIKDFCSLLISTGLNKKINWVSTARVDNIDEEIISMMKNAGCSLVAIGFESGSDESLKLMKKNTNTKMNLKAAEICKKYGLEVLGYFLIGFPWEEYSHLKELEKHIFELDVDYIEISILVPFLNTPIYNEFIKSNNEAINISGYDSYRNIYNLNGKIEKSKLIKFRNKILIKYYTRPKYIINKLSKIKSLPVLLNYLKYGFRLIKNSI